MKIYTTYEEPLKGKLFTEKQMKKVYKKMADKTEYPSFDIWFHDMLKSGVFEQTKEKLKLLSGSFLLGCGIIVWAEAENTYYHLLVLKDKETGKLFVSLDDWSDDVKYFEEDIKMKEKSEIDDVLILNNRQHYFLKEIERLKYSQDEAYAEIINNKRRFAHYAELEKVIKYIFEEKPKGRIWAWKRDKRK